MLKNYVKIISRSLLQNRLYSSINIIGLAVSLTCFLLVFIWVLNQLSYDRFFNNSQYIYRVNTEIKDKGISVLSADNISPGLKANFPEIVNSCRVSGGVSSFENDIVIKYGDKEFFENGELSADQNFFEFFSYNLLNGTRKKLLDDPNKIVISKRIALKIFGSSNPVGKILTLNPGKHKRELMVSGVIDNVPENSHLKFNFVTLLRNLPYWGDGWTYIYLVNYVQLSKNVSPVAVENKIGGFVKKFDQNTPYKLHLQPLTDIHLYSQGLQDVNNISAPGDIKYVYIFAIIAVLILLLASINFINLSIASSLKKAKEVGIRKIIGSGRYHLILQFLGESIFSVIISVIIAFILIELILPEYNKLIGAELNINLLDYKFLSGILVIILFTGIISGSYPALVISSFNPLNVIQGTFKNVKGSTLKKILVIFQFVLSIGMIASVLIIQSQLKFIMTKNLGFKKDQVIYFNGHSLPFNPKDELQRIPSVENVTWSSELPLSVDYELQYIEWRGKQNTDIKMHYMKVDQDFLKTYNIQMKDGRNFSKEFITDEYSYLLNETAAKTLELNSPIGKQLVCPTGLGDRVPGKIIGVVKDFHFNSLHTKIEPLILGMYIGKPWFVSVKISANNINQTITQIESTMHRLYPDYYFNYKFLDQTFESQYQSERRMSKIFGYFTIFIILISFLGLFGLVSISVKQNLKEIGIRKVLGASLPDVVILLTKKYIIWIIAAGVISCPITFFIMNKWLQNFAYRIEIQWWMFAISSCTALIIALLTVGVQAAKTAMIYPASFLKYE